MCGGLWSLGDGLLGFGCTRGCFGMLWRDLWIPGFKVRVVSEAESVGSVSGLRVFSLFAFDLRVCG